MTTPATSVRRTTTLHLARLRLSARSRDVHRDLRDVGKLHDRVQSLFPDQLGPTPRRATHTLFRLESEQTGANLLVQSTLPINRNALPPGYADSVEHRDIGPLLNWLTEGRVVRYRIDANPIKAVRTPQQRGRRVPLHGDEAVAWWHRKGGMAGLDASLILDMPQHQFVGRQGTDEGGKKRAPVRLNAIRFEGVATVIDPEALREAITQGIGQGRAYGLGLLSVAPHRP